GYVTLNNVLSVSSIMFRMRSNAMLLTIITIVSALAISLLSLTYISYYSAEKTAEEAVPIHFTIFNVDDVEKFRKVLEENKIEYITNKMDVIQMYIDMTNSFIPGTYEHMDIDQDISKLTRVISHKPITGIDVSKNEAVFTIT